MSDQRRTDHSQIKADTPTFAPESGELKRFATLGGRIPLYIAGGLVVLLTLAWMDGGAEPLHPITQAVELNPSVAETE